MRDGLPPHDPYLPPGVTQAEIDRQCGEDAASRGRPGDADGRGGHRGPCPRPTCESITHGPAGDILKRCSDHVVQSMPSLEEWPDSSTQTATPVLPNATLRAIAASCATTVGRSRVQRFNASVAEVADVEGEVPAGADAPESVWR